MTKEYDVEAAVKLALTWKGNLDVMANNAGVAGSDWRITRLESAPFVKMR